MKYLSNCALLLTLLMFSAALTYGQDEKNGVEFYAGYSWLSLDTGIDEIPDLENVDGRFGSHGFNASLTGNVHRYVGIKGDFSYHSKSESFTDGVDSLRIKFSTTQFLGGLQFKDNRVDGSRFRPFAHVLGGIAHQKLSASGTITSPGRPSGTPTTFDESASANNFAMVIGGGIDVNVSRHLSVRVIQADYNPVFFRDRDIGDVTLPGRTQNNFRLGFGLVFH